MGAAFGINRILEADQLVPLVDSTKGQPSEALSSLDREWTEAWAKADLTPAPKADRLTVARRLSLALTGSVPSLEEIRRLEALPPEADATAAWLDHLFADDRYPPYLAERLARAFVGVEPGPFLVYRRRRLVTWLAEQLAQNRPYDELVRELIAAEGIWTTNPAANFLTVSIVQGEDDKGPDEEKLAARTARAFLGISLDCVQCHDDKFGDRWDQRDFHQLASFFAQAEMTLTGLRENADITYQTRLLGDAEPSTLEPIVPFAPDLCSENGPLRARLATWVTAPENRPFARAAVNRVWSLLCGRALCDPIDDIPLEGPYPAGMETLADAFIASGFDLQHLIRLVAGSAAFSRDSRSEDPALPITAEQEAAWAAFPVTPLRPEQVAGSVIQASSLSALDGSSHILDRLRRFGETREFLQRFGDPGESELIEHATTIPQRLLLMNGKLVEERTAPNPILSSSTRLAHYAPDDAHAIKSAFLALLTRYPAETEAAHFSTLLEGQTGDERERRMADLHWSLINSTEFSWNR
jgi:hypothetical protein